jgi:large subunit ribosomal protein L24
MNKIRKGDKVTVLVGKYKGSVGVVRSRLCPSYLLVDGLFLSKKHQKPNPSVGRIGGVIQIEMPVHQSKLALVHPETGKPCRVRFSLSEGKLVRMVAGTNIVLGA